MTALLWIGYAPAGTTGIEAPAHHRIAVADGVALALRVDPNAAESEDGILSWATQQNAVLSAYATAHDVLPVPLGSVFTHTKALVRHVDAHKSAIAAALADISGHAEYAFQVRAAKPPPPSNDSHKSGRSFLLHKRDQRRGAQAAREDQRAFLSRVSTKLEASAKAALRLERQGADRLLDLALLVPRSGSAGLIEMLRHEATKPDALGLSCRLIGPGPAYSFAMKELAHA